MYRLQIYEANSSTVLSDTTFTDSIPITQEQLLKQSLTLIRFSMTVTSTPFQKAIFASKIAMSTYLQNTIVAVILYSDYCDGAEINAFLRSVTTEICKNFAVKIKELEGKINNDVSFDKEVNAEMRDFIFQQKSKVE